MRSEPLERLREDQSAVRGSGVLEECGQEYGFAPPAAERSLEGGVVCGSGDCELKSISRKTRRGAA